MWVMYGQDATCPYITRTPNFLKFAAPNEN